MGKARWEVFGQDRECVGEGGKSVGEAKMLILKKIQSFVYLCFVLLTHRNNLLPNDDH